MDAPLPDVADCLLSDDQRQQLQALLRKHQGVFNPAWGGTGNPNLIKHHIQTGNHPPIKQQAYRTSPDKWREKNRQFQHGIFEESCSLWSSPVVLVKKKNNTWRFCVDYRGLNAVTIKDSHPLPRVDDTLDALAGTTWFSTLDFSDGYQQVEVAQEDREKATFHHRPRPVLIHAHGAQKCTGDIPVGYGAGGAKGAAVAQLHGVSR